MKKANINVNESSKVVTMSVAGQMTMEDAKLFVEEYVAKVGPIQGPEYDLFVDCTEMKLLPQEMSDNLTEVMKMYKETGFKKVVYTIKENVVLKMQLARVARNAGLSQASVEEA